MIQAGEPAEGVAARTRRPVDLAVAGMLAAAALALYVATLAPTVLPGDPGEFQFVPPLLGIAHPTGYPLYCLLGGAWSRLPLASPLAAPVADVAYRMNLFSAVAAALAAGLAYPTILAVLRQAVPDLGPTPRRLVGVLAAAVLAVTPTLWSQAVIAEVYGLNTLLVVGLLWALLAWGEEGRRTWLTLAALCFGLGLAHHSTMLLWAPAGLAYAWLSWPGRRAREAAGAAPGRGVAGWLLLAACSLGPLLLYAYVPLRAPHTPYLRQSLDAGRELVLYENTLDGLVDMVTGGPFGGAVDLSVNLGERLAMAFGLLWNEVGWAGLALALAGIVRLAVPGAAPGRRRLLALTGLAAAALLAFNLVYTIGDIYVLFIPFYVIVILWLAVGAGGLLALVERAPLAASGGGRFPWAAAAAIALLLLPLALARRGYPAIDQSANVGAQEDWEAILARPLPAGAVLLSDDRNDMMPLWYLQYVHGRRPDLLGLFPLITAEQPTLGSILDLALSTGRPVSMARCRPQP